MKDDMVRVIFSLDVPDGTTPETLNRFIDGVAKYLCDNRGGIGATHNRVAVARGDYLVTE